MKAISPFGASTAGCRQRLSAGKGLLVLAFDRRSATVQSRPATRSPLPGFASSSPTPRTASTTKFTTPAGVKTLQTSGKVPGLLFHTEDIGIGGNGDFTGALGGRVGPCVTWDTFPGDSALKPDAAGKDTYIGAGATPHKITGSPCGAASNVFRIEGPGINPNPTVHACPTLPGSSRAPTACHPGLRCLRCCHRVRPDRPGRQQRPFLRRVSYSGNQPLTKVQVSTPVTSRLPTRSSTSSTG